MTLVSVLDRYSALGDGAEHGQGHKAMIDSPGYQFREKAEDFHSLLSISIRSDPMEMQNDAEIGGRSRRFRKPRAWPKKMTP